MLTAPSPGCLTPAQMSHRPARDVLPFPSPRLRQKLQHRPV